MRYPLVHPLKQMNIFIIESFMILFVSCVTVRVNLCSPNMPSLNTLPVDGHFNFHEVQHAARDFGNRYQFLPMAVLHPKSVSDIATLIKHIWDIGPRSELTVAARGHGHSLHGQSQAHRGVVVNMKSLKRPDIHVYTGNFPYADVSGGELWINILHESLRYGLAPKSWTDYLHLTVGGTLSNAGISGQAFRHGPQISNVRQLEVVTGKGEIVTCSEKQNDDLFHGVLGGLGQFGIITRARILLEAAPVVAMSNLLLAKPCLTWCCNTSTKPSMCISSVLGYPGTTSLYHNVATGTGNGLTTATVVKGLKLIVMAVLAIATLE